MKLKTSITLSADVVQSLDALLGCSGNRSALIEQALRGYLASREQQVRDARDLAILNCSADRLNQEAEDVLSYQVEL